MRWCAQRRLTPCLSSWRRTSGICQSFFFWNVHIYAHTRTYERNLSVFWNVLCRSAITSSFITVLFFYYHCFFLPTIRNNKFQKKTYYTEKRDPLSLEIPLETSHLFTPLSLFFFFTYYHLKYLWNVLFVYTVVTVFECLCAYICIYVYIYIRIYYICIYS